MRKLYLLILLLGMLVAPQLVHAHDFTDGTLYYSIISEEEKTVAVVHRGGDYNSYLSASYIEVPATVTYGGTRYTVTTLGNHAFYSCNTIQQIDLPVTLKEIYYQVFYGCANLSSVEIPRDVSYIWNDAFEGSSLSSITVDSENEYYTSGNGGVLLSKDKTRLVCYPPAKTGTSYDFSRLPSTVQYIDNYAFLDNKNLQELTFPSNIKGIGDYAFYDCSNLTSVELSEGLEYIYYYAFAGTNITSIYIPSTVNDIGGGAFNNCPLTSISVDGDSQYFSSSNGVLFNKNKTQLVTYPKEKKATSYTVPSTVTSIASYAFYNNDYLTSVTLPEGLQTIEYYAFYNCSNLSSINIPSTVTSIGGEAFGYCNALTSLELPEGLQTIGNSAFWNCNKLSSINIPSTVTSIGGYAFYGCSSLTSLELPEGLQTIPGATFYGCSNLSSINIPSTVTSIGEWAFYGCSSLTSIDMKVTEMPELGSDLFYNVSNLSNINLMVEPEVYDYCVSNEPWSQMNVTKHIYATKVQMSTSRRNINMYNEGAYQLTATPQDDDNNTATNSAVWWSSSDTSVATVSSNGWVYPQSEGSAIITATAADGSGATGTCRIDVINIDLSKPWFLKDNTTGKLLSRGGKEGTWVTEDEWGIPVQFSRTNHGYRLSYYDTPNLYYWWGTGIDGGYTNGDTYYIMPVGDGYRICGGNDVYYGIGMSGDKVIYSAYHASTSFLTLSQRNSLVNATKNQMMNANVWTPAGVTSLNGLASSDLTNTYLASENKYGVAYAGWTLDAERLGSIDTKNGVSGYTETACTLSKHFTGLPMGIYRISIKALYRDGTPEKCVEMGNNFDWLSSVAYIEANGNKLKIYDYLEASDDSAVQPNTLEQAKAFFDNGDYSNTITCFVGKDGVLDLSIHCPSYVENGWMAIGQMTMTHYDVSATADFTLGDVNNDEEVNIGDLYCVASRILGNMPSPFVFKAADIDGNGSIEVADYVGVTNIILGTYSPSKVRMLKGIEFSNELSAEFTSEGLCLSLQNESNFTAAQMDITLPEGVRISSITRSDRLTAGHGVAFRQLANGKWRLLLTSAQNDLIQFSDGELFTINLSAQSEDAMRSAEVTVDGIQFVEPNMTAHMLDDITLSGSEATAVGAITIDATAGSIYTLQGTRMTESKNMKSGIYVVNGKKVVVK